jgi:2'-5' RNA ligase
MTQTGNQIRAFIAVALPTAVENALGALCQQWAKRWPEAGVRWVHAGNIHLTLRFLGNIDVERIDALGIGIDEAAAAVGSFDLVLGTVGAFPTKQRPGVVWVGPVQGLEALVGLREALDRSLAQQGWVSHERSFRPHLTVGRVRRGADVPSGLWETSMDPVRFKAESLRLIESRLKPERAEYHLRHEAILAGP